LNGWWRNANFPDVGGRWVKTIKELASLLSINFLSKNPSFKCGNDEGLSDQTIDCGRGIGQVLLGLLRQK
jgi:hypothetical protein